MAEATHIRPRWRSRCSVPLAILCLCVHSGCSRQPPAYLFAVHGQILVGGRPVANASVAFHPNGSSAAGACPVAVTRSDGSYVLTTFTREDGAPAGEYIVTIIWPDPDNPVDECDCPDPAAHDLLRGVYADRAVSSLHATVCPGPNEITLRVEDVGALLEEQLSPRTIDAASEAASAPASNKREPVPKIRRDRG